jgi:hypothetical protein
MSRRILSIPVCAAAALLSWEFIPGTAVDRMHFSLTAKTFANSDHFVSGKGTYGKPFELHTLRDRTPDLTGRLPTDIVITDDPEKAFQESPPSPVDIAVILKNLRRMGRDSAAIGMPLTWADPDVISLSALDRQLDAFPSVITAAPLARSPVPTPLPPAFRRGSLPLVSIEGDPSLLPRVDRIPIPDVVLGNNTSLAGFTILESEEAGSLPHLLARWDDRAVLSFHLLAALQHSGVSIHEITIRLGEWISLGTDGPFIPIDEFGRLTIRPPVLAAAGIPAETLIDAPDDFLTASQVLIRNGLTTADPAAAVYSEALVPTVAMLADPEGTVVSRTFPRLPMSVELLLIASLFSLLYGLRTYPLLSGKLPLMILTILLLIAHFILVPATSHWIPTFPLVACALAAIPFSASHRPPEAQPPAPTPPPVKKAAKKAARKAPAKKAAKKTASKAPAEKSPRKPRNR